MQKLIISTEVESEEQKLLFEDSDSSRILFLNSDNLVPDLTPDAPSNFLESSETKENNFSLSLNRSESDRVVINQINIPSQTNTWSYKIKAKFTGSLTGYLIAESNSSSGDPIVAIRIEGDGRPSLVIREDNGANETIRTGTTSITGSYHTLALTYDGTTVKLHVDDTVEASYTISNLASKLTQLNNLTLGAIRVSIFALFYQGLFDEFQLWQKTLSPAEIEDDTILEGDETDLVMYHRFEEGSGTTSTDETGSYNGSIVGAEYSSDVPFGDQTTHTFTWDAVAGVDGYNIYISVDGGAFAKHNGALITELEYSIEDLASGDYQVYVTSEDVNGESDPSNIESFTI